MKKNNLMLGLVIVVAFVLGGSLTYVMVRTPLLEQDDYSGCQYTSCTNQVSINEKGISDSVDAIYDAVLFIENYNNDQLLSTGTGFVYKTEGEYAYVLTNHHVIEGGNKVTLTTSEDIEIEGEVLGSDQMLDLAVIKTSAEHIDRIAKLGTSEESLLGDTVFTVGSPLGYEYRGTVTSGRLSGKDRLVTVGTGSNEWIMKVLQTDAPINPGNSGGPLVNINGEVIGIISLKLVQEEVEGMGFAIPIELAQIYIPTLEKGEVIERPMIGIQLANLEDTSLLYSSGITVDENLTEGAVVVEIVANSGAANSDLQKGDIITKIGDEEVEDVANLRYELYLYNIGDTIDITYIRDGKEKNTKVTLGKTE